MRRIHLIAGIAGVLAFLITGHYMRHIAGVETLGDSARLMFRSRHIYVLATALVNLMLGIYMHPRPSGWRLQAQYVGSALVIGSTGLMIMAFVVETKTGFREEMWQSAAGLYALFAGSMAHFGSAVAKRSRQQQRFKISSAP